MTIFTSPKSEKTMLLVVLHDSVFKLFKVSGSRFKVYVYTIKQLTDTTYDLIHDVH
jgi:hypothetical protein